MFKVFSAFAGRGQQARLSQEEKVRFVLTQARDFEIALQSMDYLLDDRTDEGLALLDKNASESENGDQTINVLARGVIEFLEATLGFETEEMKKASETLGKAEALSLKSRQYAQKMDMKSSSLYPPGTVYAVTYTESCLLHALLMIFSESMIEAAKALLKLRKAYYMLQEIFEAIKIADKQQATSKENGSGGKENGVANVASSGASSHASVNGSSNQSNASIGKTSTIESIENNFITAGASFNSVDIPYELSAEQQEDNKILEEAERIYKMRVRRLTGAHIGNTPAINRLRNELGLDGSKVLNSGEETDNFTVLNDDLNFSQATIDEFIISGVNLCYGILQVVLSLLPSGIGQVLSIVGFKGSREDGLRLVWRATKHRNIHGCIGLLGLMFYYDGPFQFTDDDFDIPAADATSLRKMETSETFIDGDMDGPTLLHPGKILEDALLQSRALFPNSALWLLNEATMLAGKGRLVCAVKLMDSIDCSKIQMRQVKSLMIFNRAIFLVHLHEYDRAAKDLLSLLEISSWSHALYNYFAGSCYLEIYRMHQLGVKTVENPDHYKELANKYIFGAPNFLAKKSFKSKPLPLDRFMARKVEQFKETQKAMNLSDPLDAIGTSPVHELAYFYNGYNRMSKEDLETTKKMLTEYKNPYIESKDPNQELIKNLLVALTMRRLGDIEEGCQILDKKVLPAFFSIENDKVKYIKKVEDPWLYPAALYERALFTWKLKHLEGLSEAKEWLVRAQNYADDYELSTRIEMKIKAAIDRVDHSL